MPGHTKHNNPNFKLVIKQLLQSARKITSGKKNNRCRYLAIEYTLVRVSPRLYDEYGVCSIWFVHGGTAVDPPLRRQQVLHVVLL